MIEQPANVRLALADDIPQLYFHLVNDLEADNSLQIDVSPKAVLETVKECCEMRYAVAGIIDGPHGIMGSIGIRAMEPWFSKQTILSQTWLFVTPYARTTGIFDDLFRFAEWHRQDMSQRVGYDIVLENSVLSFTRLPAKIRLWGRYGKQIGAVFWTRGDTDELRQEDQKHPDDDPGKSGGDVGVQQPSQPSPRARRAAAATLPRKPRRRSKPRTTGRD